MTSFLGVCIAFLGACIAWGQYYVARQKLVLELFDKRFTCFDRLTADLLKGFSRADITTSDLHRIVSNLNQMHYLFGGEVGDEIHNIQNLIVENAAPNLSDKLSQVEDLLEDEKNKRDKLRGDIAVVYLRLMGKMPRYLHMPYGRPRPPLIWLKWVFTGRG